MKKLKISIPKEIAIQLRNAAIRHQLSLPLGPASAAQLVLRGFLELEFSDREFVRVTKAADEFGFSIEQYVFWLLKKELRKAAQ